MASSLPGIGYVTPSGLELLSMTRSRKPKLLPFDRNILFIRIDDKEDIRQTAHLFNATQGLVQFGPLTLDFQEFLSSGRYLLPQVDPQGRAGV